MDRLQLILRSFSRVGKINSAPVVQLNRLFSSKNNKNDSDSDGETKPKKNKATIDKLNFLLQEMVKDDVKAKKLDLAKPKNRREIRSEPGTKSVKSESVEKKIVTAVKKVAETIGGNTKQTESELLSKLLNPAKENVDNQNIATNLSDIIKGMKIDRETKAPENVSRANQVRLLMEHSNRAQQTSQPRQRRTQRWSYQSEQENIVAESIDLFGSQPLGIFNPETKYEDKQLMNQTWERLYQRELQLAVTHPHSNYFQEMILWTEQGKIWKFPIDNEQGLETEKDVYFAEHVFLDKHLEPWCPQRGPLRHFMELVCVGLSKNSFLTVEEKKEHIDWYKNYFEDKKKLLKEVGAFPDEPKTNEMKEVRPE